MGNSISGSVPETGDPRFMTSLSRGLTVLRAFEGRPSLTVSQAAGIVGLHRSSVARCLYTLEKLGYVSATGPTYRLKATLLPLIRAYTSSDPLAKAAQPVVGAIRERIGESSSVAVLEPNATESVIYVCRAETSNIVSMPLLVGSRLPSYCTSMGRVLLAALPDEEIDVALDEANLLQRTPSTISAPERLKVELSRVREEGFAIVDQELELGLRSIAVPVRSSQGRVVAALNIGAPVSRHSVEWLRDVARPELQAAAAHLSQML